MMPHKAKVKHEAVNRIRTLAREGHSANYIQKRLKQENAGIRRSVLLAEVRRAKGQEPKRHVERYVPKKYRERVQYLPVSVRKRVAVYGTTVNRKGVRKKNRIELYGTGRNLYRAVTKLHEGWIPKKPYEVVRAENVDRHIERGRWEDVEEKS